MISLAPMSSGLPAHVELLGAHPFLPSLTVKGEAGLPREVELVRFLHPLVSPVVFRVKLADSSTLRLWSVVLLFEVET